MRKIALFLSLVVVLVSMVGCTNASGNTSGETAKHPSGLEPVTLKWYLIGSPQQDLPLVLEELNAYTKEKINATIDLNIIGWGDYNNRMQVITTSGENYDIAFTCSWANNYVLNAMRGSFVELTDLMETHGKEMKAAIDPMFLEGAKIDGGLYAIPTNKEIGQQAVLVFNKGLVDKYDLDVTSVKTLADLEPLLKVIKENEPSVTPIATFDAFLPFDSVLQEEMPFAFDVESGSARVVNKYEEAITLETLSVMHDFYKKGYIKSDAATSSDSWPFEVPNWFVRKELYQPYAELIWQRSAGYELVVQPLQEPYIFNNSVTGSMHGISVTSKNPERAMMFLNLLNTDPYVRNLIDKGIEGVHYTKNEQGTISDLPARIERYNMPSFALGNLFILDLYDNDPSDKWEAFDAFNQSAIPSPALGFYFDSTPVRTEIAAISNVSAEFAPVLLKGVVDPSVYLSEFNKKLNEAGMQKVLAEIQRQFDAWSK